MILVATGTHHAPFDRLVRAADALARDVAEPVVLQRGASRQAAPHCTVVGVAAPETFDRWLKEARVVVVHAGSSTVLQAWGWGRRPIVVPRRPEYGEHVDEHQVHFAESLEPQQAAVIEPQRLITAVREHWEPPCEPTLGARSRVFATRLRRWTQAWIGS